MTEPGSATYGYEPGRSGASVLLRVVEQIPHPEPFNNPRNELTNALRAEAAGTTPELPGRRHFPLGKHVVRVRCREGKEKAQTEPIFLVLICLNAVCFYVTTPPRPPPHREISQGAEGKRGRGAAGRLFSAGNWGDWSGKGEAGGARAQLSARHSHSGTEQRNKQGCSIPGEGFYQVSALLVLPPLQLFVNEHIYLEGGNLMILKKKKKV